MAEATTTDTGLMPRTYFRAPRVPFDFRAVVLAIAGYLVFRFGSWLLGEMFSPVEPVTAFFMKVLDVLRELPYIGEQLVQFCFQVFHVTPGADQGSTFWHVLVGGVWTFAVWSFFGQAIHRITSLRIARDEGMTLKEAVLFAIKNFPTIALCPVIVAAAIGLFYGCNAFAGLALSIPWVGQVIALVAGPLALISTLLILLIALGGALGMPLVSAAAAWERNGSLDAISRAFSYVFARPLQFFWNYFLIFLFTGVILLVGGHFERAFVKSVDAGIVRDKLSLVVDTPSGPDGVTTERYDADTQRYYDDLKGKIDESKGPRTRPFALSFKAFLNGDWGDKLTILVFWILLNLVKFGVAGYALYWFIGATTSTYADLRQDVDGTEEDEIYLEEEEDLEAEPKTEGAPGAATPPETGTPPAAGSTTPPPPPPPDVTPPPPVGGSGPST